MSSYRLLSECSYWGSVCWAIRQWLPTFKVQQYISVWLHNINLQRAEPTDGTATFDSTHSRENKSRRSHQPQSLTVPNRVHVDIHHSRDWRLLVSSHIEYLHTALSILKSTLYERSCSRQGVRFMDQKIQQLHRNTLICIFFICYFISPH